MAQWQPLNPKTEASFRSLSVVNKNVVWAGGSGGTILKTIDGGENWRVTQLGKTFDFRGIQAFSDQVAVAMSAGEATTGAAKIFRTTNGGQTWDVVFETNQKGVFLDCLKFKDDKTGYVLGDPIDGKPYVLKTVDGGVTWFQLNAGIFPAILEGEASFAASNSNISVYKNRVLFSTQSRIFISEDEGKSWRFVQTPFEKGATAGIFGLYFVNARKGFAVGGDYVNDKADYPNVAYTEDGGETWAFTDTAEPKGLKESVWKTGRKSFVAVGTSGTSRSTDNGKTWQLIDNKSFHVIQCVQKTCYAVGGKGQVAKWGN